MSRRVPTFGRRHPAKPRRSQASRLRLMLAALDINIVRPCADCQRGLDAIFSIHICNVCASPVCGFCWPFHMGGRRIPGNVCHERESARAVAAGEPTRAEILARYADPEDAK